MGPTAIRLFTYRVGYGDCALLRFEYPDRARHVLVDFGSSAPAARVGDQTARIAEDIADRCGGRLEAIVVTHRHSDHLSGFAGASWEAIRRLEPRLVLLPWTEDPDAAGDFRTSTRAGPGAKQRIAALGAMGEVARAALQELRLRGDAEVLRQAGLAGSDADPATDEPDGEALEEAAVVPFGKRLTRQLAFLGQKNLTNEEAVANLASLPREFLSSGRPTRLEKLLPGVKVHVLGPPTLEERPGLERGPGEGADEFWPLAARAAARGVELDGRPFPRVKPLSLARQPLETRWFVRRMDALRGEELLELVRALDAQVDDTSLILLFEACGKKLLFSGDAQLESWSHALAKEDVRELLEGVDVYKVGHHGSGVGTPKSLWRLLQKRPRGKRLITTVSTRSGRQPGIPHPGLSSALALGSETVSTLDHTAKDDFVIETAVEGVETSRPPRSPRRPAHSPRVRPAGTGR